MNVVVWLEEGTWEGCLAAAAATIPAGAVVSLVHVTPSDIDEMPGAAAGGLFGRGHHALRHPYEEAADEAASEILATAAVQLGGQLGRDDVNIINRHGQTEREVISAAAEAGADLLVVARDGDRSRLGPHSLGHATRFVVDHAPCSVLLVWPDEPPGIESVPPPKHGPHGPPPPQHHPH
ncbi:MAG: universal stress protein [Actinobacteria bacterium]|nr:universal stress protein [Actinomycetota bacterium]